MKIHAIVLGFGYEKIGKILVFGKIYGFCGLVYRFCPINYPVIFVNVCCNTMDILITGCIEKHDVPVIRCMTDNVSATFTTLLFDLDFAVVYLVFKG